MQIASFPAVSPGPDLATSAGRNRLAFCFGQIALDAGVVVMDVFRRGASPRTKPDLSPVCEADESAEALIKAELARLMPGMPILAEESASRGEIPDVDGSFILVDPVDGTKEFLSGTGEFTVNIALVEQGVPRAGAVYAPALGKLWLGGEEAFAGAAQPGARLETAALHPIHVRPAPVAGLVVMASRRHGDDRTEAFLAGLPVAERQNAGSSLKFCMLAEGEADLYPRFSPTMEWDTAAGDAVLRAAGGMVVDPGGRALGYGKAAAAYRNGAFVAWGDPAEGARRMVAQL